LSLSSASSLGRGVVEAPNIPVYIGTDEEGKLVAVDLTPDWHIGTEPRPPAASPSVPPGADDPELDRARIGRVP
jgi:hypothetical protein